MHAIRTTTTSKTYYAVARPRGVRPGTPLLSHGPSNVFSKRRSPRICKPALRASHIGTHTASTSTWSPRSAEATGSATRVGFSPARLGLARHGLRAHSYCVRVGGDSPHCKRAPCAYRKHCESVPAATAASAGDLRALLPEFDTSLCRYLLSPRSRVQFGATGRGPSVSAGGWHRRVRCSARRCSLAVSGHGSGAAKPAKTARRSPLPLVERPVCRNHSR